MPTGNMLVKRLVEDLDRQMQEIGEHEDALMGQVCKPLPILSLKKSAPPYLVAFYLNFTFTTLHVHWPNLFDQCTSISTSLSMISLDLLESAIS